MEPLVSESGRRGDLRRHLRHAADALGSRLEAELLIAKALSRPRAWLLAHGEFIPDARECARIAWLLEHRAGGMPIAYLLGEREFYARAFRVGPDVLIPRPETEHLVEFALGLALPAAARIADIGTGSGCIGLTLAAERPGWQVTATDICAKALAVAAANRSALGLEERVELLPGDLFDALDDARDGPRFHLIVSNPPYVAHGDGHLHKGDLRFEPGTALVAGRDGLAVLGRLAAGAPARLRPGGWLALEHGHDQAPAVRALLADHGFGEIVSVPDLAGIERVTAGRRPGASTG